MQRLMVEKRNPTYKEMKTKIACSYRVLSPACGRPSYYSSASCLTGILKDQGRGRHGTSMLAGLNRNKTAVVGSYEGEREVGRSCLQVFHAYQEGGASDASVTTGQCMIVAVRFTSICVSLF